MNSRYHISHIYKGMWNSPVRWQMMITESKNGNQFVKFINMLMNDTKKYTDNGMTWRKCCLM
jgi:ubiquitin conjugation factor E4 B